MRRLVAFPVAAAVIPGLATRAAPAASSVAIQRSRKAGIECARDVLWLATSPELYELVGIRRAWSADRYPELSHQLIMGALL
jgi:hypothetical protein